MRLILLTVPWNPGGGHFNLRRETVRRTTDTVILQNQRTSCLEFKDFCKSPLTPQFVSPTELADSGSYSGND